MRCILLLLVPVLMTLLFSTAALASACARGIVPEDYNALRKQLSEAQTEIFTLKQELRKLQSENHNLRAGITSGSTNELAPASGKTMRWDAPPPITINQYQYYKATIRTNSGDITVLLFSREAPMAVNSFIFLSTQGFYDGLKFHRVVRDYLIQTGDPTGTGDGGPGYTFAAEPVAREYRAGTLAMAGSGPDAHGSQFFIMLVNASLPKTNTIFGVVVSGLDVAFKIGRADTSAAAGQPSGQSVEAQITSITVDYTDKIWLREIAATELSAVQAAVSSMMAQRGLSTLPPGDFATVPTNDMSLFPDPSLDSTQYVLYHEGAGSGKNNMACRYTTGTYTVNAQGQVSQVATGH